MISSADLSRMSLWSCLLLGIFFTRVSSQNSGLSNNNGSFISHENRSFLSHQKIALRNLADASISESCKTAVDDSTSCRESLSNAVKANCKGTEDIFSHYTVHGTAGAPSWIRGQSGLTGSTNHVRTLMEKELSKDNVIAWVKAYAKELWVWYIFLGFALVWIIVGLIWSPGLCSVHFRRCLGKCFCKKCCNQRIRARPLPTVTRTKYCLFLWWFVVTSVVLLAFVGLAIFDSVQIHKVSSHTQCVLNKLSYVSVFGVSDPKSKFKGVAGISEMLNAASKNANDAADAIDRQKAALDEYADKKVKLDFEWYIRYLKANREHLKDHYMETAYKGFDRKTPITIRRPFYCLQCELAFPIKPGGSPTSVAGSTKWTIVHFGEALTKGIKSVANKTDALAKELRNAADEYSAIAKAFPSQTIIDDLLSVFDMNLGKYYKKITSGVFAFVLTAPLMIFIVWVVSLVLYSYLWTRYSKQKTTNHKQLRNWFGCLCWFFTLCGILVLVVGVLSLMAAQPVSEGCEFAYNDLMTDNKFMEYEGIKSSVEASNIASLSAITNECLTTNGKGDLKKVVEEYAGMTVPDNLSKIGEDHMKIIDRATDDMIKSVQYQFKDHNEAMGHLEASVMLGTYGNLPSEADFYYLGISASMYGVMGVGDMPLKGLSVGHPRREIVEGIHGQIYKEAKQVIARKVFRDRNGNIIPSSVMVGIIPAPILPVEMIGDLHFARDLGDSGCAVSRTSRYKDTAIDIGAKGPTAELSLKRILDLPSNKPFKDEVLRGSCCKGYSDAQILQWVMSYNMFRLRDGQTTRLGIPPNPAFAFTDRITGKKTAIPYNHFQETMRNVWEELYEFKGFKDALKDAKKNMKDTIAPVDAAVDSGPWNCQVLYDQFKMFTDFVCYNGVYDIGRLGMSWILMAFGLFILSIITWKVFHYFADLRFEDVYYSTPEAFFKMSRKGRLEELKVCCQLQVAAEVKDEYGNSGLHIAAYHRNPDCCSYLLTQGLSPDENNQAFYSPMHVAVVAADNETVKRFIEAGADMRQYNYFGDMPLHSAAMGGDKTIIDTLLEAEEKGSPAPLNLKEESPTRTANRIGKEEIAKRLGDFFTESSIRSLSSLMHFPTTPRTDGVGSSPINTSREY